MGGWGWTMVSLLVYVLKCSQFIGAFRDYEECWSNHAHFTSTWHITTVMRGISSEKLLYNFVSCFCILAMKNRDVVSADVSIQDSHNTYPTSPTFTASPCLPPVSENCFHDLNSQNKFSLHRQNKIFQLRPQIILLLRVAEQFM